MKKCWNTLIFLSVLSGFGLLIRFPAEAARGAAQGLRVCGEIILPSLFPFLAFSGLCTALGLPTLLARLCGPLLRRMKLPPYAAVPLLLGLTGGYPAGAAAVAELVKSGAISRSEAAKMLPWCNNTGPAFLIGAAGTAVFGSARIGIGLYLCHALASLSLALLWGRSETAAAPPSASFGGDFAVLFPACIRSAAASALSICAFVVFFSVLTALLSAVGLFSALSAAIALRFGTELQFSRALLTGLMELGSGIGAMSGLAPTRGNLALASFLIGFGGLSVQCQTLSVTAGAEIKCARHFVGRIAHGALSALYTFLLFTLLRI